MPRPRAADLDSVKEQRLTHDCTTSIGTSKPAWWARQHDLSDPVAIVAELSRLGRSMLECMEILALATRKGVSGPGFSDRWRRESPAPISPWLSPDDAWGRPARPPFLTPS